MTPPRTGWWYPTRDSRPARSPSTALTDSQVTALTASHPAHHLPAAAEKWAAAADRIIDAFHADRHAELRSELDDYSNAPSLISDLKEDSTGQEEWFAYTRARAALAKHGLDTAIDFCIEQRVGAEQVPHVIEKALLRSWADYTIQNDTRIRPLQERERSALVQEYRKLDKQLILSATSDIIRAVNTRRPSVAEIEIGEPGVIRCEGMKKSRYLPVRELISWSRNTSLAIKPCFMMSPLVVSQYLPADMSFDVVIFDEASQVTPGDAINCIYRGRSLILAGDDKQLPPTSFFERVEAESDFDESDTGAAGERVWSLQRPPVELALPQPARGPHRVLELQVLRRQARNVPQLALGRLGRGRALLPHQRRVPPRGRCGQSAGGRTGRRTGHRALHEATPSHSWRRDVLRRPDSASTLEYGIPPIQAGLLSVSNAMAISSIPPQLPVTATGYENRFCADWAGGFTGSGEPHGIETGKSKRTGCVPQSQPQSTHPRTAESPPRTTSCHVESSRQPT